MEEYQEEFRFLGTGYRNSSKNPLNVHINSSISGNDSESPSKISTGLISANSLITSNSISKIDTKLKKSNIADIFPLF